MEKNRKIIFIAANAAMNMNQWDKLEKFMEKAPEDFDEKNFFNIVILIQKDRLDDAKNLINKSREMLDSKVINIKFNYLFSFKIRLVDYY